MSLVKWAFLGLVALPAAEVVTFLIVAAYIGWFWAGITFVSTSVLGVMLLKHSGRRDFACFAQALRSDGWTTLHLDTPGAANLLAALLLVFPGFITDALGAALLVPAFRRRAAAALAKSLTALKTRRRGSPSEVIDLEPGEWRQIPDREPRRRRSSRHKAGSR